MLGRIKGPLWGSINFLEIQSLHPMDVFVPIHTSACTYKSNLVELRVPFLETGARALQEHLL